MDDKDIYKNKRTICLLNDSFPPIVDGVANAVLNYARIIEERDGHSIVATPYVPRAEDKYDFPVIRYPSIDTRRLMGYVTGYPFSPETAHAVQAEGTDLLHTHCPVTSALLARQLAESLNLPLVMTWHTKYDIDISNAIKSKVLQEGALQALLRNVNACDEIWTVSEGAGDNLRSIGYDGEYIVMPNGVDLPHKPASDDMMEEICGHDLPGSAPCFLFIGRLMWYKGLRIILDALKELDDEDIDYRMVFVGDGNDGDEVKAYSEELGLGNKMIFTGAIIDRDSLRAWYSRADLFLFPSTFDTNGLVVREAAASDTASVIIEGSCAAEGVTDGRNGFFIDEKAESLAAMLRELIGHPEKMKEAGIRAGSEIYISWEDAVAKACDRYEIVIDRFKRGDYGVRDPIRGSWLQSQGELMQILGNIGAAGREVKENIGAAQNELDRNVRSIRNKALTDIIVRRHEAKESINDTVRGIWDYIERYL